MSKHTRPTFSPESRCEAAQLVVEKVYFRRVDGRWSIHHEQMG